MQGRAHALEGRIQRVKAELFSLGVFCTGSLSRQWNVCGKPGCSCKGERPRKHGPYFQLSFTRSGKSSSSFVRRGDVPLVQQHVRNYARFRILMDRWISLSNTLAELQTKASRP
jgi:hypothetical protein